MVKMVTCGEGGMVGMVKMVTCGESGMVGMVIRRKNDHLPRGVFHVLKYHVVFCICFFGGKWYELSLQGKNG